MSPSVGDDISIYDRLWRSDTEIFALLAQGLARLEPTLALAATTMLLAIVVALPLGVLAAYRHGGWLDR